MAVKIYNKLVRDRIPDLIAASGERCVCETLSDARYAEALDKKLAEEAAEYLESGSVEELADIFEVILAILETKNISVEKFQKIRREKADSRGGFAGRIFLKETGG